MTLEEYQKKKYGADIHQKANAAVSSVQAEASAVGLERANQRQYFEANPGSFTGFLRSGAPNAGFTEKVNAAQWDRQWNPAAKRDVFATAANHQNWQNNPREMSQITVDLENAKKAAAQERSDRGVERGYLEDADYLEFSGASPHHAADLRRQVGDMAASEQIADRRVKDLEEEKYWTEYYRYMNLPQSEEYEKYAAIGKNRENPSVQDVIAAWQTGTYDEDMIRNIVEYSRANYDDVVSLVSPVGDELYSQLTEEEVKNYNYLLAKDGKEAAQAYLDFLSDQINRRKGHELAQPVTNIKSPFLRGVAALPTALGNSLASVGKNVEQLFREEELPTSALEYSAAEMRESLGKGGKMAFDVTSAVGNMIPSIAASAVAGPWAGLALTGASSAGGTYAQLKQEGYSTEQARTVGVLVGAAEGLLQYALGGIGAIGGVTDDILMAKAQMLKSSLGRLALGGVIKVGSEVAEEELQLLLEPLFRTMVLNEKYQGPTWSEVWDTAVITTLSTAILEGHSVAGVELNYKAYGDMVTKGRSKQEIVNSALRYSAPGSNADVLATDLAQQIKDGKTVSNSDIGRLYSFMLTEANANKFVDSFDLLDGLVPEAKENTSPANMAMDEAESTAVNTDPSQHTPEEQAIIEAYQSSVDQNLVDLYDSVNEGNQPGYYQLKDASPRAAQDIFDITGNDVSGFQTRFDARQMYHVKNDHGPSGKADRSMADSNDVGRIQYVLDNYDSVEDGGTTAAYWETKPNGHNRQAKTVIFKKKVNGTYYVVEAAPVTKAKRLYVVSAYMEGGTKKEGAKSRLLDAEAPQSRPIPSNAHNAPGPLGNPALPITTVPQPTQPVNGNNSQNSQENDLSFLLDNESERFENDVEQGEQLPPSVGATDYDRNSWSTFQNEAEGGYHPEGANAARPTDVPKRGRDGRNISRVANNAMGAQMVPDRAVPDLEQGTMRGDFSYDTITDQGSLDNAQSHIDNVGFDVAFGETMSDLENGTSSSKQTIVNGFELVRRAYQLNSTEGDAKAMELLVALQSKITDSAQALQAASMMRRLTPEGQLMGLQRTVDRINQNTKGLTKNIEIDPNLRREFLNAESEESRATALSNMYADIGRQIPATFKEKWDNWRYLAMLANPRTHIRNFFGNAAFMPVRGIGNQLSALGQLTLPKEQRTRSLGFNISAERRALVDAAKNDFETNTGELVMSGDKYNSATNIIDKNKRVFQFKPLEAARKGNGGLLEVEDKIFSKQAYVSALAGYLNARGYTAQDFTGDGMTQQQKDDARSFAIKEAQKATYRDANAFSDLVTSIGFKKPKNGLESGINALVEGVLPFKKTPANILVRAFEYSPAGLTKTVLVDGIRAKKGSISANEFIDNMSKGLTGSAVFALGMLLAKWGVIKASPEDEEQSELEGRQTYSLEIGGKSITLDWAAPGVIPLFMGVELKNAIDELTAGESISLADIADVFSALTEPMENMSMLDGLNSTIESAAIAAQNDQSAIGSAIGTAALNYFTQAFPTIFGQIERAIAKNEWVRQTTFIDKESEIPTGLQYTLGRVGNKIPGFDFAQVPYVDAWGRTQDNGNVAVRAANNMLNPSYISDIEETDVDREIKRLEEATGENFTPSRVKNNKLSVNGKTVFLTEDEFFTYATAKGQNDLIFRESLLNDPKYEALDDAVKGKLQNASEEYAKVLAMQEAGLKPELSEWQEELQDADIQTITDKLISNAVEARAMSKGKELGGGKYDGLAWLYDEGQIDDEMAISEMSNTMQTAYGNFSDSGKAFTADEMIDVYAYANKVDGTSKDKLDAAVEYIRKEWPNDSKKALALFDAMEATLTYSMTRENEVDAKARAAYGGEGQRAILDQMTDNQQSNYGKYVKNSGVTAYEFELALKYKSEHKKDEVKAYLERCGYTYAQQQAILNGLYKQK